MGKKFTLCRIGPSDPFQQFQNRLLLPVLRHHGLRDILMVSVQTGTRFFECLVGHTAAADIYFTQFRMIPGINHLGTADFQYFPNRFLHHLHIVRLNVLKPVLIALFRFDSIRHAQ